MEKLIQTPLNNNSNLVLELFKSKFIIEGKDFCVFFDDQYKSKLNQYVRICMLLARKMKFLKKYELYTEEDMDILDEKVLDSINAKELDPFEKFNLPKKDFNGRLDVESLSRSADFVNSLLSIGLKKSSIINSEDYNTFFKIPCKFMFIFRVEANELENPDYIFFQSWSESKQVWLPCRLFEVNGNIKNFYDKLSSRTITVDDKYIYNSPNGSEWILMNSEKSNSTYKKYFRNSDFEIFLKNKKIDF